MITIADSGAIYALIDADDDWHERIARWWSSAPRRVMLPNAIVPEVSYLLQTRISSAAEVAFVKAIRDAELVLVHQHDSDIAQAHDLMATYSDLPLGFVDAMVMATALRLDAGEVLTTDRRHFGIAPAKRGWALVP